MILGIFSLLLLSVFYAPLFPLIAYCLGRAEELLLSLLLLLLLIRMSQGSSPRANMSTEEEEQTKKSDIPIQHQDSDDQNVIKCLGLCEISDNRGICAICLDKIPLQETALVKGCEHAYCVTCILIWATYNQNPSCPQCKHPFQFLNVHRSLDGSIHDYMFEESVCLLVRAQWFVPLPLGVQEEVYEDQEANYQYEFEEDNDDDLDESYYSSSSSIRIGNRRWGDNGYVRAGHKEARPVLNRERLQDPGAGSSRGQRNKEPSKDMVGRRAKRAMKREAADKAAAAKHQQHLLRLGRK